MRSPIAALVPGLLMMAGAAHAVVFNDGGVHTIDAENSFPFEDVFVEDGPGGAATTVWLVSGGAIGSEILQGALVAHGHSIVLIEGGTVHGPVLIEDSSEATINAGTTDDLLVRSDSRMSVSGGDTGSARAGGDAYLEISGGSIGVVGTDATLPGSAFVRISGSTIAIVDIAQETSTLEISGGTITREMYSGNRSVVRISGGNVLVDGGRFFSIGRMSILGGVFGGEIHLAGNGFCDISGGTFDDGSILLATANSSMTIFGTEFNYPWGNIQPLSGTLIGTLVATEDSGGPGEGTPINIPFGRASTASIILAQPFPIPAFPGWAMGALSVLLIGSAGWLMATRRRRLA
jgi:hypothetical protein